MATTGSASLRKIFGAIPAEPQPFFCASFDTTLRRLSFQPDQLARNPLRDLRHNGISGSESLRKVGRIQSEAKPIIFRRSLPLNHLIPCVRLSDESGTAHNRHDLALRIKEFQFRDIRPRAASDIEDISHASKLLGHSSERITKDVYRRVGEIVRPTK